MQVAAGCWEVVSTSIYFSSPKCLFLDCACFLFYNYVKGHQFRLEVQFGIYT